MPHHHKHFAAKAAVQQQLNTDERAELKHSQREEVNHMWEALTKLLVRIIGGSND
jgi:hypothetical protein